jgi:NAD(P)-dependent dehydrogenase (short-subunit alcohol dehydrogenase family)
MSTSRHTCVITGANRGLGLSLSKQLMLRGWHVIGTARNVGQAWELHDAGADVIELDVASDESIAALSDRVAGRTDDVSMIVNNAGLGQSGGPSGPSSWPLTSLTSAGLTEVFRVNTIAPLQVASALSTLLTPESWIVSMSSKLGSMTVNFGTDYGYNMSKAALNMATVLMAKEFADRRIGAVTIHPGWVRTDMGGPHADLDPDEAMSDLASTLLSLTLENSGQFLDWLGRPMPW